jgi:X-Pro dipeptidyl-peptidase
MGEDIDVLYDFINSGAPDGRKYCDCEVRDKEMLQNFDRVTGDYNAFWAGRNYREQLKNVKAATLMAHAFNDWNVMPEHSVEVYAALKKQGVPCQAYFHQGAHGGEPPHELMNRWFSRYLYGVKNDVEKDPRAWIVREGERRPTPYPDYPNPEAAPVRLHPYKGGSGLGALSTMRAPQQGTEMLVDDVSHTGGRLAQAGQSPHRLLYATPQLTEALHLSGTARIKIRLASSKPAANLSIWIVSLPWDEPAGQGQGRRRPGRRDVNRNLITRGWADPQNHKSLTASAPLRPGEFYELSFDLQPDDQIIPIGQQIGLMIFSSDREFTLWPKAGTELTVDLDATSLTLPVVGGAKAFERATRQGGK